MDYDMVYVIFCGDSEYIPSTAKLASTFFALRKTAEQLRHVHYRWRINLHGKFFWLTSTFCLKITELGFLELVLCGLGKLILKLIFSWKLC